MSKELLEAIAKAIEETGALDDGTGHSPPMKCSNLARAVFSAIERKGFKVVPVEPTREMCEAGDFAAEGARNIWREMLSAAPKQG